MRPTAQSLYTAAKTLFSQCTEAITEYKPLLNYSTENAELVDLAYACRETVKFLDEARKNLAEVQLLCEKAACAKFVRDIDSDATGTTNIQTPYVTATPKPKQAPNIPSRKEHPKEYCELLAHLGMPQNILDAAADLSKHCPVTIHWPGLVDYCTERMANGLPVPPGCDPARTYILWELTMRRRKEVDET